MGFSVNIQRKKYKRTYIGLGVAGFTIEVVKEGEHKAPSSNATLNGTASRARDFKRSSFLEADGTDGVVSLIVNPIHVHSPRNYTGMGYTCRAIWSCDLVNLG